MTASVGDDSYLVNTLIHSAKLRTFISIQDSDNPVVKFPKGGAKRFTNWDSETQNLPTLGVRTDIGGTKCQDHRDPNKNRHGSQKSAWTRVRSSRTDAELRASGILYTLSALWTSVEASRVPVLFRRTVWPWHSIVDCRSLACGTRSMSRMASR